MKINYKTVSMILFIAFIINLWIIKVQRKEINMYKDYVDNIHEVWISSGEDTGWHKETFIIPEK